MEVEKRTYRNRDEAYRDGWLPVDIDSLLGVMGLRIGPYYGEIGGEWFAFAVEFCSEIAPYTIQHRFVFRPITTPGYLRLYATTCHVRLLDISRTMSMFRKSDILTARDRFLDEFGDWV